MAQNYHDLKFVKYSSHKKGSFTVVILMFYFVTFSKIDTKTSRTTKIYPLPHMYVVKDLVPVSTNMLTFYISKLLIK